jgi:hypothetical protein
MTTADWALVISILSAMISLVALAWNVWSKFIYPKPSFVVTFSVANIWERNKVSAPFFSLSITNHGPIPATVTGSFARMGRGWFKRPELGFINPLSNFPHNLMHTQGPFSGGLPKKLEVGEEFSLKYWYGKNWMDEKPTAIGVRDTFGRFHWCSRTNIREAAKRYEKDKADGKLPVDDEAM